MIVQRVWVHDCTAAADYSGRSAAGLVRIYVVPPARSCAWVVFGYWAGVIR